VTVQETVEEEWKPIEEFQNYQISNLGRIYSEVRDHMMSPSVNNWGHIKITLSSEWNSTRWTRSVAQMVAHAFVENPEGYQGLIHLDGDPTNVAAHNLAWRPKWFEWKYSRQFKEDQPIHYTNLPVIDNFGNCYDNIIEAGQVNGMLYHDIWMSCHDGVAYLPNTHIFEIDHARIK
jgi:hypothetical protein